MSSSEISINVADALPYLEQKFLRLFGKDNESKQLAEWFKTLQGTALTMTSKVQCLGMRSPVPFDSIYQPTRLLVPDNEEGSEESFVWTDRASRSMLRGRALNKRSILVDEFLRCDEDAVLVSGPGWGKTTLLHSIFRKT